MVGGRVPDRLLQCCELHDSYLLWFQSALDRPLYKGRAAQLHIVTFCGTARRNLVRSVRGLVHDRLAAAHIQATQPPNPPLSSYRALRESDPRCGFFTEHTKASLKPILPS
jgi:hypothetical protein